MYESVRFDFSVIVFSVITFTKDKELKEYLVLLEEAKKRDHRKLGKEMELFTFLY